MAFVQVTLAELRDKLGLVADKHKNIDCPFCSGKKKLHFSDEKEMWHCVACKAGGQTMHFFARYQLGIENFPSDKTERKKISEQLQEFMGIDIHDQTALNNRPAPKPKYTGPQRPVAKDDQLHAVYTAMASMAVFQLTANHKKELKRRGLTEMQIQRNGYRTYPPKTQIPSHIVALYNSVDPALRAGFSQKKAEQTQFGLYVARTLQDQGYNLEGIPGFYKFGEHWCLLYCPGILIPTRNIHGQIVVWQVRRNFAPKYLTLSCGDRPGATDDAVSRCHFPLANDPISPEIKVIFTEGPLKADVAKALSTDPCAYVAIQGVGNKTDLLRNCKSLKKAGVKELYNALDMDRLTNPNVREGSAKLTAELQQKGMTVIPMYWGEKCAARLLMLYQTVAYARRVTIPPHHYRLSVYDKLNITADALNRAGINPGKQMDDSEYWESETKGIDDYLHSLIEKKERTHTDQVNCKRIYQDTLLRINSESSF